jgi:hypothetical protein
VIFLLSPAWSGGKRARMLMSERASFPLAVRLRAPQGAPIGEVFSFLSGLYFRGKLAYARAFGSKVYRDSVLVITPARGLVHCDTTVSREELLEFATIDIATNDPRFRVPFERDIATLAARASEPVVLLGSVATGKYIDALVELLGERLLFPGDFVGRGDMSRGGLLLRRAREGVELDYIPVAGAIRHGPRPPKLSKLR